jgi:hypothetical protein
MIHYAPVRKLVWACLLTLLSACSATGPQYSSSVSQARKDSERSARLVLYRELNLLTQVGWTQVKIDGYPVGGVADSGFNYYDVTPGAHRIVVHHEGRSGECAVVISIGAGQTQYFKVEARGAGRAAILLGGFGLLGAAAGAALEGSGDTCAGTWEIKQAGPEAIEELKQLKETQGNG